MKKLIFLLFPLFSYGQMEHVYHKDRLQVIKVDTTVTGTVTSVIDEDDGDWHIRIGRLNLEFICQCETKYWAARRACKGYNQYFAKPMVGQNITVTGPYCYDKTHDWYEIHPVQTLILNR